MKINLEELKKLDPNNPGVWPIPFQLMLCGLIFVALIGAGWYFDLSKQRLVLADEIAIEAKHKDTYDVKQKKAANLGALKEQMKEMNESFGDMLRQLPNKTEVAGLIVDISQTGLSAGLEFDLFQPGKEVPSEFYAELPISLKVFGTYHQLGEFISGIAQLPRIVTTHNLTIDADKGGRLLMTATAKTYRAIEDS